MVVLVVLALLGLFGGGPLSRGQARDPSGALELEYERFQRHLRGSSLRVHVRVPPSGAPVRIWIDRAYVQGLDIQSISPRPVPETAGVDRVTYEFV